MAAEQLEVRWMLCYAGSWPAW